MNKKIQRLVEPNLRLYLFILVAFAAASLFVEQYILAAVEGGIILLLVVWSLFMARKRRRELMDYLESVTYDADTAKNNTLMNFPLPMAVFSLNDSRIVWANQIFFDMCGVSSARFEARIDDLVPEFNSKWLYEGKTQFPGLIETNGRKYQIHGNLIRPSEEGAGRERGFMGIAYWVDVTEYDDVRIKYEESRPVVSIIVIDNYDEMIRNQPDRVKNELRDAVEDRISQWCDGKDAFVRRYDRDRYVFVFEDRWLSQMKEDKFSILERVHEVVSPSGIHATVSIGLGVDGSGFGEDWQFASLATEMALSRGGDQAVVKNRFNFEFFGGRAKETEKRTKVKSRVMASALGELVADASCVFVMGHAAADMDAVGAAVGVCAIARKKGVPHYIVRESGPTPADQLYRKLEGMEEYKDLFLDSQETLLKADSRSLLVVVDTNRPEQVASREVLQSCNKVAVIDHHRRAATYIEGGALYFHEPYASSTCELVSELLSYLMEPGELLRGEAEAMMAGLMLDTKNFTMRTGGRTFEAAAFLRRAGGDTGEVKKMFQTGLADTVAKYGIIQNAKMYRQDIAIAPVDHTVNRVTAAQAADELLNIAGINTSFVLYPDGDRVVVSARSINDTNVQVILEALGGGGNAGAAGAQIAGQTLKQVTESLMATLERYFKTDDPEEMGEEEE